LTACHLKQAAAAALGVTGICMDVCLPRGRRKGAVDVPVRKLIGLIPAAALVVVLAGCGASSDSNRSLSTGSQTRPSIGGGHGDTSSARAADTAQATETEFHGWKALSLTNGLVTLTAVPEIGGRIMEYKLGANPFLWVNEAELGKTYEAPKTEKDRTWHNFGGYKAWPAPQEAWGGPPDPLESQLDGGRWTGKILSKSGQTASIQMTSPEDSIVTGLQIVRTVTLYANSTRVQVKESFRNVSNREIRWSIWDVTQVPGVLTPGESASSEARIYLPLNPKSAHPGGFVRLGGDSSGQWEAVAGGRILQTTYGAEVAKIGADSDAGWATFVDEKHGVTFAKTFEYQAGKTYPDQGSSVQVFTNGANLPYMELEVLSPLHRIEPGQEVGFEVNWHCARVGGPTLKVTSAAAIKSFPQLAKKDGKVLLSGEVGVFAPGDLKVVFLDGDGKQLGTTDAVKVSPTSAATLAIPATVPEKTATAMVVLNDAGGAKVGNVAELRLSPGMARKDEKKATGG